MNPPTSPAPTRRQFLRRSAAAAAAPMVLPGSVLGQGGKVAPSERITMACVGVGGMGTGNLQNFLNDERVQVVAICDVDAGHRRHALNLAKLDEKAGCSDFREIAARDDIDTVMIATPDHWHALISSAMLKSGKDLYCEKPLAACIAEGRHVADLVKAEKRVLQCGTWRRSGIHTRKACQLVRNGYIGELKRIEVGVPGKFAIRGGFTGMEPEQPVPDGFDYEMWLGPAPAAPYTAARCHFNFRWVDAYAPGYITDWGAHFLDVAQWGNGSDDTCPVEVHATKVTRRSEGIYDAAESFDIEYAYANGVQMRMFSTTDAAEYGTKFIGTKGWVFTENMKLESDPPELIRMKFKESDVALYESNDHRRNFIDCVLSRGETAAPAETAHRAATACHLGAISAAVGKALRFDPEAEKFTGDGEAEANALLARPMRGDWSLG